MVGSGSAASSRLLLDAAHATLTYLASSQNWERVALAEGAFHTGDDPIHADLEAHSVFERHLRGRDTSVADSIYAVVGEESIQHIPLDQLMPGARVVVVDPLDGSTQWAIFSHAYCVAAYCLVVGDEGRLRLESAIVANPQHSFTWRADREGFEFRTTRSDDSNVVVTQSAVAENPLLPPTLSFTGFKTKDRPAALSIAGILDDWQMMLIGGNPVTPYVISGGLTVALTLRPQASWDAVGILLASKTDAVIGALDGTLLDHETFRTLFEKVVLEGNVRRIPALVVAKSRARYDEVVERLAPLVNAELEISPSFRV